MKFAKWWILLAGVAGVGAVYLVFLFLNTTQNQLSGDRVEISPELSHGVQNLAVKTEPKGPQSEIVVVKDKLTQKRGLYTVGSIEFPNGEIVEIDFFSYSEPITSVDLSRPLRTILDELEAAARAGDIGAASTLGDFLYFCSEAPLTKAEYETRVEGIETKNSPSSTQAIALKLLSESYESCDGVSSDKVAQFQPWLELAAKGGDLRAINRLFNVLGPSRESGELLIDAWQQGFIGMGHGIAMLYSQGLMGDKGEPDHVSAYAHALATNLVWAKVYEVNNSPQTGNAVADLENALNDMLGSRLSPQEQIEAEALAHSLLQANPNCCVGSWENYGLHPADR